MMSLEDGHPPSQAAPQPQLSISALGLPESGDNGTKGQLRALPGPSRTFQESQRGKAPSGQVLRPESLERAPNNKKAFLTQDESPDRESRRPVPVLKKTKPHI